MLRILFVLFLFVHQLFFAQTSKLELVIPDGISNSLVKIIKNPNLTQAVFNENDSNKILVWDLEKNKEQFNATLTSKVLSIYYHPNEKYIYVGTKDCVYIFDAETGKILKKKPGSNYQNNPKSGLNPFINQQFVYLKDNDVVVAELLSDEEKIWKNSEQDYIPHEVIFDSENQLFFVTDGMQILTLDKNLNTQKKYDYGNCNTFYTVGKHLIMFDHFSNENFKSFDLQSGKLLKDFGEQNNNEDYITHFGENIILKQGEKLIQKNLLNGNTEKTVTVKLNEIYNSDISQDQKSLLFYGKNSEEESDTEVNIVDLQNFTSMKYKISENENSSFSKAIFDEENFNLYQFSENEISKNSIFNGQAKNIFKFSDESEINFSGSDFGPSFVSNQFLILNLQDKNFDESIVCFDANTFKQLWSFSEKEMNFFNVSVDKQNEKVIVFDYPSSYTVIDIPTGKKILSEKSDKPTFVLPINKNKILKIQSNSVNESLITEYSLSGSTNSYKIPAENLGEVRGAFVDDRNLYVQFNTSILSFDFNDFSKAPSSKPIHLSGKKVIDIIGEKFLYTYSNTKDRKFNGYVDWETQTEHPSQEDLYFFIYHQPLKQILLKDSEETIYLLDEVSKEVFKTDFKIKGNKDFKIYHDQYLVYKDEKNYKVYDLKKRLIKNDIESFSVPTISRDGNLYYDFGKIKSAKNGKVFTSLPTGNGQFSSPSKIYFSNKNGEILYFDENQILTKKDLKNNSINTYPVFPFSYDDIKFELLNSNLVLASKESEGLKRDYKIIDVNSGNLTDLSENSMMLDDFKVNDKILSINTSESLKIFDLENAEQILETPSYSYKNINGEYIIYDDSQTIKCFDLKTKKILWENNIPRKNYKSYISDVMNNTVFITNDKTLYALDLWTGEILSNFQLSSQITLFYSDPMIVFPEKNQILINIGNDFKSKYQLLQYQNKSFVPLEIPSFLITDSSKIKQEYNIGESDNFSINGDILAIFNYSSGRFSVQNTKLKTLLFEKQFTENTVGISWEVMEKQKLIFMYNNSGKVWMMDYQNKKSYEYNISGNKFVIEQNKLYVSNYGKSIDVYNIQNPENLIKMYTLVPLPEKEYLIYNEKGYYLSTKNAAKNIQFRKDDELYSFEQFDLIFNRPDLVLQSMQSSNADLEEMYQKAVAKRLKRQGYTVTEAFDEAPEIEILTPKNSLETDRNSVEIELKADGKNQNLSKIIVKVNDNLYKEISAKGKNFKIKESIILNKGANSIEVYALNSKNIKSTSEKINVVQNIKDEQNPKVYFFGIGVSNYKDSNFNLRYAAKDVKDTEEAFKSRYSNIETTLLIDEQVTVENIKKIKQKIASAKTDDLVIIAFCGHGVLDKEYNWYFATHDLDFSQPQKRGFSYNDLMELTSTIECRQKLVTIDACHSGEIDSEEISTQKTDSTQKLPEVIKIGEVVATKRGSEANSVTQDGGTTSFALMKEMFSDLESSNGTVVISASGGMEYAFEGGNYKNGVFTFCMLNELNDSIWNNLKISELQKTVMEKVYKLTNGKQQPNVRAGTLNYDWIVW